MTKPGILIPPGERGILLRHDLPSSMGQGRNNSHYKRNEDAVFYTGSVLLVFMLVIIVSAVSPEEWILQFTELLFVVVN